MEWLREIKLLFNRSSAGKSDAILKSGLVLDLQSISNKLPLQDAQRYYTANKVLALSLGEIVGALEAIPDSHISWDQILDMIISVRMKSSFRKRESLEKTLEISFPQTKLLEVPEYRLHDSLEFLSLAGNTIGHTDWNFPISLIVLNLAGNDIRDCLLYTSPSPRDS